jgi:hypothetical protein
MYTLQGKPDQHATRIPRSVCVWSQTIRISHGQRIATFHVVINRFEQIHCSREEGLPTQPTAPSFYPRTANEAVGKSQVSVDSRLLGLPGPYHWHAIDTFSTCSRGATHRSLTDIGGGYNHLRAPPGLWLSSQHKPLVKCDMKHLLPTHDLSTAQHLPKAIFTPSNG